MQCNTISRPVNHNKKWTLDEELELIDYLKKNIDIKIIPQNHERTIGSIESRKKIIGYKMYLENNDNIDEICKTLKLEKELFNIVIDKYENGIWSIPAPFNDNDVKKNDVKKNNVKKNKSKKKKDIVQEQLDEIKTEIKDIKNVMNELVEMMKAVYEFEDE